MDDKAHGIVLRIRPLTETSQIVHWLTRDQGRIATVAKGARRPKSPFRGKLDLFFRADFSLARSRRSELHTLREVMLTETFPAIRLDFDRVSHAAYAAELIELATETETPVPEFFELYADWLGSLNTQAASRPALLAFEWRLLGLSGVQPEPSGSKPVLELLQHIALEDAFTTTLPTAAMETIREAGRFLGSHLHQQLNRLPVARARLLFA
jgi:DNA repair protein RecO (recombination protein O)